MLHANPAVPFSVDVSEHDLSIAAGADTSLTVLTNATPGVAGNGTFTDSWSSYNPNEVQVTFSPNPYPTLLGPTGRTSEAEFKVANSVSPGNYTVSIGIDAGAVRVSSIVRVEVTQGGLSTAPLGLLPLYLALVLAAAVAGLLLRRKIRQAAKDRHV